MLGYLLLILGVGIIATVHELGHYLAAVRNGIAVTKFKIFFGDPLWRKQVIRERKIGDATEYVITNFEVGWIPFGGYVELRDGFIDNQIPGSFSISSYWTKTKFLLGGVTFNAIFSWACITIGILLGLDKSIERWLGIDESTSLLKAPLIATVLVGFICAVGPVLLSWTLVSNFVEMLKSLAGLFTHSGPSIGQAVGTETMTTGVTPDGTITQTTTQRSGYNDVAHGLQQFVGSPGTLLFWLGIGSAIVGAFNLLPIPILDGGRWLVVTVFRLLKRPFTEPAQIKVAVAGVIMFLGLVIVPELVAFVTAALG